MKTQGHKSVFTRKLPFLCCAAATLLILNPGCTILGFLLKEGPFEKKLAPQYNLQENQDRKILLLVEFPHSLNVSFDTQTKLVAAFTAYMISEGKIKKENLLQRPPTNVNTLMDPRKVAREMGAGFVLLVEVDAFEVESLQIQNYFTGQIITRTALLDVDVPTAVWPQNPEGKMIHIAVEVETGGRDAVISRLLSGAAHCTFRYLYPCDKLKFKNSDERVSAQELFEMETY